VWIPTGDGTRLAARIWLPEDAERDPVPAILEYIPYRKNDATAARDALIHPYFAGHGYASVRVDLRGSGDSEGTLEDEYLPRELEDGVDVIRWLATQPWCTGAVGMIGKSWGGFNALQIAALAPPELEAVVSVCSTDDRYADDVHYLGGCVLAAEMLSWASTMLAFNARPPDPAAVGERWRELWLERLERTPPFVERWLSHQRRDAYWKHGSVCEDYRAVRCPVYMVGGWCDPYRNAIFRFLEGCPGPHKGLVGPWSHNYPHEGVPGPAIGFLQECLRWWDHWLKGRDTGIVDEPRLRAWMQESVPPATYYGERPGRWVAERSWPSPAIEARSLALSPGRLGGEPGDETPLTAAGTFAHGLEAGAWMPYEGPGELPPDQRAEDGRSLSFTSDPLAERVEILGVPEVVVAVASDRPLALLAVRLCDVFPDGRSTLVTRGLLNLAHRDGHEEPAPLEPRRRSTVRVRLGAIAHAFPPGHRIRVSLSPTYWPWAWPSPEPVTLTVLAGEASRLVLPVRPPRSEDDALPSLGEPEAAAPLDVDTLRPRTTGRTLHHDVARGLYELVVDLSYFGARRLSGSGLEYDESGRDTFTIVEGDPLSARARSEWSIGVGRGDWRTRVETSSVMTADASAFHVTNVLDAYEGETRVSAKTWHFSVPRDLV
jgi:putative CocE/NonD family hydrolase